jgi:hypothetical protein
LATALATSGKTIFHALVHGHSMLYTSSDRSPEDYQMTSTTTHDCPLPRSYMPEEEKKGLSPNVLLACESSAAIKAGDENAAWAWLSMAKIPESALSAMLSTFGKDFLAARGFKV